MADQDVTVVITAYDPGPFLRQAAESVMAQTDAGWRLLVVDDGSRQDISRWLPRALSRERLTLVRHPQNLGQSAALNTALQHVETPYFLQLDADDWLLPNAVGHLRQALAGSPDDIALVSGNIKTVYTNGRRPVYRKGTAASDKHEFLLANRSVWPRFYRTSALRTVGGWPLDGPYRGRYLEDRRVLYRLIERYRFAWLDEVLYVHRRHRGNQTRRQREYNVVIRWTIEDCLRRWGGEYHPVLRRHRSGWLCLERLLPAAAACR